MNTFEQVVKSKNITDDILKTRFKKVVDNKEKNYSVYALNTEFPEKLLKGESTTFLFHGSDQIDNILKVGLVNNAPKEIENVSFTGGYYGEGLYFTQHLNVADSYSQKNNTVLGFEILTQTIFRTNDHDEFVVDEPFPRLVMVPRILIKGSNNLVREYKSIYKILLEAFNKVKQFNNLRAMDDIDTIPLDYFASKKYLTGLNPMDEDMDETLDQMMDELFSNDKTDI